MKNFIKNNLKVFVTIIISGIVFTGIGVYAASQYFAKDISFTPTNENFKKENGEAIDNVEDAINELYNKKTKKVKQVGTFTGQNQEYTFENDGYIIGTMQSSYNAAGAIVYFHEREIHENIVALAQWDTNSAYNVSIFVPKGTRVLTRDKYGSYNLTLYEFK